MNKRLLTLISILISIYFIHAYRNLTDWTTSRQKRYLIWETSGSTKLGVSVSIPVNLYDKNKKWRSFNMIFNFSFSYDMPHKAQEWLGNFNYWQMSRSGNAGTLLEHDQLEAVDLTARYMYAVLENYMTNSGVNGRQCMQRSICQNAQVYKVEGLAERIYQRLMTPEESSEEYYKDAYIEGLKGVDCLQTYTKCPTGDSFFDKFVQYQYLENKMNH